MPAVCRAPYPQKGIAQPELTCKSRTAPPMQAAARRRRRVPWRELNEPLGGAARDRRLENRDAGGGWPRECAGGRSRSGASGGSPQGVPPASVSGKIGLRNVVACP